MNGGEDSLLWVRPVSRKVLLHTYHLDVELMDPRALGRCVVYIGLVGWCLWRGKPSTPRFFPRGREDHVGAGQLAVHITWHATKGNQTRARTHTHTHT